MESRVAPVERQIACERIIASALQPVATELRMVDLHHWIAYIHNGDDANLRDLVVSSAELHFKPGAIDFSGFAESVTGWADSPEIHLNIELNLDEVTAFLQLKLRNTSASVDLLALSGDTDSDDLPARLSAAIAQAQATG